ncbi:MAG: hypothetical protein FD176_2269 [Rhodospirillaceae bacterium]|nr:MAG: hypothetical protein FD176_2269 [Rhodospirillaceae bacterium]TNC95587.1 MAG: Uncharacterized protein FD119_2215 [Stygiobacter sp.]
MNEAVQLSLLVYGLGVVIALAAAVLIKFIVVALAWGERKAVPAVVPAAPSSAGIPPHHLVVIAAAAHAMVGANRIVHIGAAAGTAGWSAEGRFAHHGSHHPATHH